MRTQKRKLTPPAPPPGRVVEIWTESGWTHHASADDLRRARRMVGELRAAGWKRVRSRLDPRSTVTSEQIAVLHDLRSQLPSRWRTALRQLWAGRPKLVRDAVEPDQIEVLRRMARSHGPRWLAGFWFVWE